MDARSFVDNHIDGYYLLQHLGFEGITENGELLRAYCKLHGSSSASSFVYNLDTNQWYCHSGNCGGGDAYQLLQTLYNINYPEAIVRMAEIFKLDINKLVLTSIISENQKEQEQWIKLMNKKDEEISFQEYVLSEDTPVKTLKKFRNFNAELLEYFGVMYTDYIECTKRNGDKFKLNKRILIPVHMNNILIGYTIRRVDNNDILKWAHEGFQTRHVLYNYDNCIEYLKNNQECEEVILVEGAIDVWAFHKIGVYNVVATFGCNIKEEQQKLLEAMCSQLTLAYDGDDAGIVNTSKIIKDNKRKFSINCIIFEGDEDPANVEDLLERYKNKIHYTRRGLNVK